MPTLTTPYTTDTHTFVETWWSGGVSWVLVTALGAIATSASPGPFTVSIVGSDMEISYTYASDFGGFPVYAQYKTGTTTRANVYVHKIGTTATLTRVGLDVSLDLRAYCGTAPPSTIEVSSFIVNWGDGDSDTITPTTSVFSSSGGNQYYEATGSASHTYAGGNVSTGIVITLTLGANWPQNEATPQIGPEAIFSYTVTDRRITFDASGSYDIDGEIVTYSWDFDAIGSDAYRKDGGTLPLTPWVDFSYGGTHTVTLTVTDADGLTDSVTHAIPTPYDPVAALDYHGRVWANHAGNTNGVARCYRNLADLTEVFDAAAGIGLARGAIWTDTRALLWHLRPNTVSGNYGVDLYAMDISGAGVSVLSGFGGVLMVWDAGYVMPDGIMLPGGGLASIATELATGDVYFTRTPNSNGASGWSTPVLVGTLDVTNYSYGARLLMHPQGDSSQLVVFYPSAPQVWISNDFGATWEVPS